MDSPDLSAQNPPAPARRAFAFPQAAIPGALFFCSIGFLADCMNFNVVLAETFLAENRMGANESELGRLGAISALGYTLPTLATGLLSEKAGRRPMLLLAMFGFTIVYFLLPRADTLGELYTLSLIRSVATALLWPPLMAWMSQISEPAALARVLGRYNISWASGILVGYGISGWATEYHGLAAPFHISIVLSVFMLLFVIIAVPRPITLAAASPAPSAPEIPETTAEFFNLSPSAARLWVIRGLGLMGLGCAVQAIILYLTPKLVGPAVGENAQGMLHLLRMAGQVLAFLAFAATAAWHFRLWPIAASLLCFAVGLVISGVAGPQASQAWGYAFLGAGYAAAGFGFGIAFMLSSYYALGLVRMKGLGSGLMETLVGGGSFVGPLIAGEIAARTSSETALLAAVVPLAAAAVLAYPWERQKANPTAA